MLDIINNVSILDDIVANKRIEIEKLESFEELEDKIYDLKSCKALPKTRGFKKKIRTVEGPALIAEVKKASPSKGIIKENFDIYEIAKAYQDGGAHCFSILTDSKYFKGSYENLIAISSEYDLPCLCKEFIIDARQILQARLSGADAILLIAAILDDLELSEFSALADEFGMDVLLEVHTEDEMDRALRLDFDLIGINNRDLNTFEVNLDTTAKMINRFKFGLSGITLVSESGISTKQDIAILHQLGVKGFLVGESLIKQDDIRMAVQNLIY